MAGKSAQNSRVVLITGANRGIGLETARQLALRGWQVVAGVRNASAGKQAVAAIAKEHGSASLMCLIQKASMLPQANLANFSIVSTF